MSSSRIRPRPFWATFLFLPASLIVVCTTSTPTLAAPAGIHVVSRVTTIPPFPVPRPEATYRRLSGDGLIAQSDSRNRIWTYPDGRGTLMPPGATILTQIRDESPDMSILLGSRAGEANMVVATRDGNVLWTLPDPPYATTNGPSFVSPDGRYVTGGSSIISALGPRAVHAGRWSMTGEFELLDRSDYVSADTVAVTNDGTVYGHGYSAGHAFPDENPATGYFRDDAVRWLPSGELERLTGVDDSGQPWRMRELQDVSPDGSAWLGWGSLTVETPMGMDEISIRGVFGNEGLMMSIWDERDGIDSSLISTTVGSTSDGSLVFVNYQV